MPVKIILLILFTLVGCGYHEKIMTETPTIPPSPREVNNVNIALALGGGGAKGFAHVGVLTALEEHCIPIDLITGTSSGAMIGALYADTRNTDKVKKIIKEQNNTIEISYLLMPNVFFNLKGFANGSNIEQFFIDNLQAQYFKDLKIPFIAITTDLISSDVYRIASGPIAPAIRASSAIPPLYPPVNIYQKLLSDGGSIEPVPVETAKLYNPKLVIAVDISALPQRNKQINNSLQAVNNVLQISYYKLSAMQSNLADIKIQPELSKYKILTNSPEVEVYNLGYQETKKVIPIIKKLMHRHNIMTQCAVNYSLK